MKKFLILFDFSGASFNAIEQARQLASRLQAQLSFLCIENTTPAVASTGTRTTPDSRERNRAALKAVFDKIISTICVDQQHVQLPCIAKSDSLENALRETLQPGSFDLLIAGLNTLQDQPAFPQDAQLAGLLPHLSIPTLLIPLYTHTQRWATITLLTNFTQAGHRAAYQLLFGVANAFHARLQLVHLNARPVEPRDFRQTIQRLGLACQFDSLPHTYLCRQQSAPNWQQLIRDDDTDLLVIQAGSLSPDTLTEALHTSVQLRLPLLILPVEHYTIPAQPALQSYSTL